MREIGTVSQTLGHGKRFRINLFRLTQTIKETPVKRLVTGHRTTGKQQFRCPALTDQPRQHGAGTHITAGQADAGKQKCGFALCGAKTHISSHRNRRTGTHTDTVNCRNNRLWAISYRFDQVTRHTGEVQQTTHIHIGQRPDNFVHVTAGAEVSALAGNDNCLDRIIADQAAKGIT